MERYVLDENGKPIPCEDLMVWGKWMQDSKSRSIGTDRFLDSKSGKQIVISTVFLGLDHSFSLGSVPVLWETMIFGGDNDSYQERYTSKEEAIIGHEKAVNIVKEELNGIR